MHDRMLRDPVVEARERDMLLLASSRRKRGRPSLGAPWIVEGVSRATWFARRNREKAAFIRASD